ncbi:cation:dicarboxylase symporter family transporter, partial [Leuconostoc mesenteroides]|uniref:dicarboxylate/amino acid:cation symporter n=1 Tax=Leuconostoc mesenteroides TaxID=1245 RepID=UPI001CBC3646
YVQTAKTVSHNGIWSTVMGIIPTNVFKSLSAGDMIPVIFFAVFFGLGTAAICEQVKIILDFMNAVAEAMFKVTNWVIHTAPIGVCALIGVKVAEMRLKEMVPLGYFIILAYITMAIFIVVVMGIVGKLFGLNIWHLLRVIRDEMVLGFSTASSEAA